MARSQTALNGSDEHHIEYSEESGQGTLVVRTSAVTITIEGDREEVRRAFERHYAEAVDESPEEIADALDTYPMPAPEDLDSIPADEFYEER